MGDGGGKRGTFLPSVSSNGYGKTLSTTRHSSHSLRPAVKKKKNMSSSATEPPRRGDEAWLLTSAALVQLMTPGLAFFYGGLSHEGSTISTLMLSFSCIGVVTIFKS